jgi:transcriptional regulator with XRE-family HTH domain
MSIREKCTDTMAEIETRLSAAGLAVAEACAEAGVAYSTWTRWRAGRVLPNVRTLDKIERAAERLIERIEGRAA